MNLVFFTHPSFLGQQSMPRFANMLVQGMSARGHRVEIWSPKARFFRLPVPGAFKKWLGYIDQYILFPVEVSKRLKISLQDTLFVFTDHALGPWVPLVDGFHVVIHCHDFLAQKSALRQIPENPTQWTGRQYQAFIRRGYSKGKNFISVSNKTRDDLHQFLPAQPSISEVVYNGLNQPFLPQDRAAARDLFGSKIKMDLTCGYLLHVGGNNWYKNRTGVIEIYDAWRLAGGEKIPLLLVGASPSEELQTKHSQSPFKSDIHWLVGIEDEFVRMAYAGASVFLFPSLAEGFGWPIAEAMASGCPVITTNEVPMSEVAGHAGFLIPRRPVDQVGIAAWASEAANVVKKILGLKSEVLKATIEAGITNSKRFDTQLALDRIESIYKNILRGRENS